MSATFSGMVFSSSVMAFLHFIKRCFSAKLDKNMAKLVNKTTEKFDKIILLIM